MIGNLNKFSVGSTASEDEGGGQPAQRDHEEEVYVSECIALILEYPYITFPKEYLKQVSVPSSGML